MGCSSKKRNCNSNLSEQILKLFYVFGIFEMLDKLESTPEGLKVRDKFIRQMLSIISEIFKYSIPQLVEAVKNAVKIVPVVGEIFAGADMISQLGKVIIKVSNTALKGALIMDETYNELVALGQILDKPNEIITTIDNSVNEGITNTLHLDPNKLQNPLPTTPTNILLQNQISNLPTITTPIMKKKGGNLLYNEQRGGLKRVNNSIQDFLTSGITSKQVMNMYGKHNKTQRRRKTNKI
jgi:hypothetical protein